MLRTVFASVLFVLIALPAVAETPRRNAEPKDPGFLYKLVRSFSPEAAVDVWRGGQRPDLKTLLTMRGFLLGNPVYIRIFKDEGVIEVWMQKNAESRFELFEVYPICKHSGALGPKLKQGDRQAPEGFYEVNARHLNPNSKYHLAINMGYPNAFDKAHARTGDFLMIHGACASIGCYALTNANIEEVYTLVKAALDQGQENIAVHAFPFRMTQDALIMRKDHKWVDFWMSDLLPVYDVFDITGLPPRVMTCDKTYQLMNDLDPANLPAGCEPIAAWGQTFVPSGEEPDIMPEPVAEVIPAPAPAYKPENSISLIQ